MITYRRLKSAIDTVTAADQIADLLADLASHIHVAHYGCTLYLPHSMQDYHPIVISNHPDGELAARLVAVHGISDSAWSGWTLHFRHGSGGERCGLALLGGHAWQSDEQRLMLADLADRMFGALMRLHRQPILRPVERDVLYWTAAGKRSDEISMILSIPERTVNEHIKQSRRKLAAKTRQQAVINALLMGEITPRWQM